MKKTTYIIRVGGAHRLRFTATEGKDNAILTPTTAVVKADDRIKLTAKWDKLGKKPRVRHFSSCLTSQTKSWSHGLVRSWFHWLCWHRWLRCMQHRDSHPCRRFTSLVRFGFPKR